MKDVATRIADYIQPSLRPDIDGTSLAHYLLNHLRSDGWHLVQSEKEPKPLPPMTPDLIDLKQRVEDFMAMRMPGQFGVHMGTSALVHDLWQRVLAYERLHTERSEELPKRYEKLLPGFETAELLPSTEPGAGRRSMSPIAVQVYCAALTGLYARAGGIEIGGPSTPSLMAGEALRAVDAFMERTK